jgi:hypothetical protein
MAYLSKRQKGSSPFMQSSLGVVCVLRSGLRYVNYLMLRKKCFLRCIFSRDGKAFMSSDVEEQTKLVKG